MKNLRAIGSAMLLFVGVVGSMGTLGVLIFDHVPTLILYGAGVTAGATWLSVGTFRSEVAAREGR